jgi:Fe-S cluster biogenesis protein NfuA
MLSTNQETSINPMPASEVVMSAVTIEISPTPNPNAMKMILDRPVKHEGNSTYRIPSECGDNELAKSLFTIRGVDQVHLFENVITITKFGYEDWDSILPLVEEVIKDKLPSHDANYHDPDPEADRRRNLSPELLKIETILDRTIRPGLQGDGGDIKALSLDDNILMVRYQGACGTCPSSTTGTLEAIKSILRDEFDPSIEVYIAPEF